MFVAVQAADPDAPPAPHCNPMPFLLCKRLDAVIAWLNDGRNASTCAAAASQTELNPTGVEIDMISAHAELSFWNCPESRP